jgi:hypothetical protein
MHAFYGMHAVEKQSAIIAPPPPMFITYIQEVVPSGKQGTTYRYVYTYSSRLGYLTAHPRFYAQPTTGMMTIALRGSFRKCRTDVHYIPYRCPDVPYRCPLDEVALAAPEFIRPTNRTPSLSLDTS